MHSVCNYQVCHQIMQIVGIYKDKHKPKDQRKRIKPLPSSIAGCTGKNWGSTIVPSGATFGLGLFPSCLLAYDFHPLKERQEVAMSEKGKKKHRLQNKRISLFSFHGISGVKIKWQNNMDKDMFSFLMRWLFDGLFFDLIRHADWGKASQSRQSSSLDGNDHTIK